MRATRALVLAILVGCAVLARTSVGENAAGACSGPFTCPGIRLPAAITLLAGDGPRSVSYEIRRDGRAHPITRFRSWPFPQDASSFGDGVWFAIRQRHLVVGRDNRTLWRSR